MYHQERWYLSPKISSCSLGGKWKMIFLKKNKKQQQQQQKRKSMEISYTIQTSRKNGIFKKNRTGIWSSLSSEKMALLFPENMIFFSMDGKWRWYFSKNTWKYDVFCIFGRDGISFSYKYEITLLSKKQRWTLTKKYI